MKKEEKCAECYFKFCPSRLSILSKTIKDKEMFYLAYVPHIHTTPIYSGNPIYLPEFLQLVLYYYSGNNYCEQQEQLLNYEPLSNRMSVSSSSHLRYQKIHACKQVYSDNAAQTLRAAAMNDLQHSIDEDLHDCSLPTKDMIVDGKNWDE